MPSCLAAVTASLISDASANGRSLIQAANFAAMRASSVLNIEGITPRGDATYTILATDRLVATNAALTASRAWTLPAANAVNPGQPIIVADLFGGVTGSNTIVITRAGSDTINGGNTVTLSSAFGLFLLWSDGSSKWIAQGIGASAAAGVSSFNTRTGAVTLAAADVAPFLGFGAGVA